MSEQNIQGKFCVFLVTHSPFDIFILHDVTEEIYIVGHTYRCHDPENGVSVNAREWFSIFFLLTWKVIEKKKRVSIHVSSFHEDFEEVEIEVRITTHLAFHTSPKVFYRQLDVD